MRISDFEGVDNTEEGEFADPPLKSVTADNIDVSMWIGPYDSFERRAQPGSNGRPVLSPTVDAREYHIIDAEIVLTDDTGSNYLDAIIKSKGDAIKPKVGDTLLNDNNPDLITVDIDNSLTESRTDAGEIKRIFTGVIANSSRFDEETFEIIAFWPANSTIQDEQVVTVTPPALRRGGQTDYSPQRKKASFFVERVGERVTFGTPFDYYTNLETDGVTVGENPQTGDPVTNARDVEIRLDSWRMPVKDVLDTLSKSTNGIWEIDRFGDFYFGSVRPIAHKVRYITDINSGDRSPQWKSVRVVGDGVVSEDGWEASAQINEHPFVAWKNLEEGNLELAEPTFTYRNMQINTQKQAENVADWIAEELRKQRGSGDISIVGHPEIWPGDAIELPDAPNQPFALDRFGVSKVTHRINNDDGFLTKLSVSGLTNGQGSTFEEEIEAEVSEKVYEYFQAANNFTADSIATAAAYSDGVVNGKSVLSGEDIEEGEDDLDVEAEDREMYKGYNSNYTGYSWVSDINDVYEEGEEEDDE